MLDVSQSELAARAHVSVSAVRAYENGRRHPSRPYLAAILDALKCEHGVRNTIFSAAGFATDGVAIVAGEPRGTFNRTEAAALVESQPWPSFVIDEYVSIVAANALAQRLWGVDLEREFPGPVERNLLSVASSPRFADRCVNWDEAVGTIMAVFKRKDWGRRETLEAPSPMLAAVLEHFMAGDPRYVSRFLAIWQNLPASDWDEKMRFSYPVVWRDPVVGVMRFECVATPASHAEQTNFNDWIPVGAESWRAFEELTPSSG